MTNSAVALDRRLGRVRHMVPYANGIRVLSGSHSGDLRIERWVLVPASEVLAPAGGRSFAPVCCVSTADFEPRDAITPQT
jgi:hypothetical protein